MPARLSSLSSSVKPTGSLKCNVVRVAAQSRATLPVLGGISGSSRTTCMVRIFGPSSVALRRFLLLSIKDFPEHQAMGGRGHPASAAVASCQHQFRFFERELSTAGLDKRAHNPPTHLIKESIGFDDEREEPSAPFNVAASQGANGGLHFVVPRSGKRFEIMLANEKVRRSSHDPEIQLVRNLPCRVAEQGIHRGMIPDKKAVLFSGRVEPCMKCVRTMR